MDITRRLVARYDRAHATLPVEMTSRTASLQAGLEEAFRRLEEAIDAHDRLARVAGPKGEPEITFSRHGGTISIHVTLKGSRKRASKITGDGATLDAAVDDLVNGLDVWAKALA